MTLLAAILQVLGLAAVVFGCFLLAPWLACVVGGLGLFFFGWVLDGGVTEDAP